MTALRDDPAPLTVALVTLGCARNDVDSEELAGRLEAGGFRLVEEPADADTVVVNTCGFVEAAKKDSVDTLLAAADLKENGSTKPSSRSAASPSGTAPSWPTRCPRPTRCSASTTTRTSPHRLRGILAGEPHQAHTPQDRRKLLPISPVERGSADVSAARPRAPPTCPSGSPRLGPRAVRRRLDGGPMAPLKLASGCDRRCTFCAIPAFRGSFVSRRPADVLDEARWLAEQGRPRAVPGQRELHVVRQGPRRPAAARDAAARAGGRRRRRAGAGVLPAARRDPARPGRRDRVDAGRRGVLRPVLPARVATPCCAGCAASATRTASSACSTRSARRRRRRASAPT